MKLYNTMTGSVEFITTLESNHARMYSCGLTVYSQPHIGNWTYFIVCDVLERVLRANSYTVTRVQNITDVGHLTDDADAGEDKMLKGALREGKTAWDIADKYIQIADNEAYAQLGLLRPTHMPRATEYIAQQIAFTQKLEAGGYTYVIADGVYFDTSKLSDYGKLARLDIEGLQFGARVEDTGKRNPTDFAVWKFSNPSEKRDMEWQSPWGVGFPGWHLECSVMAQELLGDSIDIHTGGIDHIPVHHTNEIAQTEAVTKQAFARHWVHANHLKVNGTKISKSLGNIYSLQDIVDKGYDLQAFKLLVLSRHYRSEGNFDWDILASHQARLKHWKSVAALRHQIYSSAEDEQPVPVTTFPAKLKEILSNDLDTVSALALIDATFSVIEKGSSSSLTTEAFLNVLQSIDDLLGINLLDTTPDVDSDIKQLITEREIARSSKNWGESDRIRDSILSRGYAVKDTSVGTIWSYN